MDKKHNLTIGEVARRSGISVSAVRFYNDKGLIRSIRSTGGNRIFQRAELRRVAFIIATQNLGFSLNQIAEALTLLPQERTPTKKDWQALARMFQKDIDRRIFGLERLRKKLDECIGCGCLSMKKCALYNPQDKAAKEGTGAQYLVHDKS